jgi:hypothetical protein
MDDDDLDFAHPVPAGDHTFPTEATFTAWLSDRRWHLLHCQVYLGMISRAGSVEALFEATFDEKIGDGQYESRCVRQRVTLRVPGGAVEEDYSELHPDDHKPIPSDGFLIDQWDHFTDEDDRIGLRFYLREVGSPVVEV